MHARPCRESGVRRRGFRRAHARLTSPTSRRRREAQRRAFRTTRPSQTRNTVRSGLGRTRPGGKKDIVGTRAIPSSLLAAVLLAALTLSGCTSGTDDSPSPAGSAAGTVEASPEAADSPDQPPVSEALLTPDEFLEAIGEDGQVTTNEIWPSDEPPGQAESPWYGELDRLCLEPDQLPDVQARGSIVVWAPLKTRFDEFLMVAEPAVIADTFETLRELDPNECAWDDEHPGISYQPAPVGDAVLAWELYGGPTNVDRFIAVQQQDTLIMMQMWRMGDVPEGQDLTREQVDAVVAAATAKVP